MIILDTNVISETMKAEADQNVIAYLDTLDPGTTYITSITVAEILYGIDRLDDGRRKKQIEDAAFRVFQDTFKDRILSFDFDAASHYAYNAAAAKKRGKTVSFADGMIAGIARHHIARVATRDVTPFEEMGIQVINPWIPAQPENWSLEDDE